MQKKIQINLEDLPKTKSYSAEITEKTAKKIGLNLNAIKKQNLNVIIRFTKPEEFEELENISTQNISTQDELISTQKELESLLLRLTAKKTEPNEKTPLIPKTKNQVDKNKHKMYKTEETGYDNPAFVKDEIGKY